MLNGGQLLVTVAIFFSLVTLASSLDQNINCFKTVNIMGRTRGYLQSDGFPSTYYPNASFCWLITVQKGFIIRFNLTVAKFDECLVANGSSVSIFNGNSKDLLIRECDKVDRARSLIVKTTDNVGLVHYYTPNSPATPSVLTAKNLSNTVFGFEILFQEINITSGESGHVKFSLNETSGSISSDETNGCPYSYNQLCSWNITVPVNLKVRFNLQANLERCFNCSCDRVTVYDGSSSTAPILFRSCDNILDPEYLESTSNSVYVEFETDNSILSPGGRFNLDFTAVPQLHDDLLIVQNLGIRSHSDPVLSFLCKEFLHNLDICVERRGYSITAPPGEVLKLSGKITSNVTTCKTCSCDALEIYDGPSTKSNRLAKLCKPNEDFVVKSLGMPLFVNVVGSLSKSWFYLLVQDFNVSADTAPTAWKCNTTTSITNTRSGVIESGGYPKGYTNNLNCTWIITVSPWAVVRFSIENVSLEPKFDSVTIYDGDKGSKILWKGSEAIRETCQSSQNRVTIQLLTDFSESIGNGFRLTWTEESPKTCPRKVKGNYNDTIEFSNSHVIRLTFKPETQSSHCWHLATASNYSIRYTLKVKNWPTSDPCSTSYVAISDDFLSGSSKICSTGIMKVASNQSLIVADSGNIKTNDSGFELLAEQIYKNDSAKHCPFSPSMVNNVISSNNSYFDNIYCEWEIHSRIVLELFWIESCVNCSCDFLEIYDGKELLERLCGESNGNVATIKEYTIQSKMGRVRFVTDSSLTAPLFLEQNGFRITFVDELPYDENDKLVAILCSVFALLLIIIVIIVALVRWKKYMRSQSKAEDAENGYLTTACLKELLKAHGKNKLSKLIDQLLIPVERLCGNEVIASGNFGIINKATLKKPGFGDQLVALKSVKSSQREDLIALIEEAEVMCGLEHENILPLLGLSIVFDQPHIVVPFMELGNLHDYLRERLTANHQPSIEQLASFCFQICSGMTYLSSKGCVHRDLACRNILLNAELVAKISDFGLGRRISKGNYYRSRPSSSKPLPVSWHPPESLQRHIFETKSDVWSFGVCMWEIFSFCAEKPYAGIKHVIHHICEGHLLSRPAACPKKFFTDVVTPCWHYERRRRPSFSILLESIRRHQVLISSRPACETLTQHIQAENTCVPELTTSF